MNDGPLRDQEVASVPPPTLTARTLAFLRGKKTHILVAGGILYILGSEIGLWPCNDAVLGLLGLGGLSTIRDAIKNKP